MAHFDVSLYETVAQRLVRWWAAYPNGRILTSIHHYDKQTIVMRAEGYNNDGVLISTGYAEEIYGNSPVNKTSFVENAETSCLGRMISNSPIGDAGGDRPSMEEMVKVSRINAEQAVAKPAPSAAPADRVASPSAPAQTGNFATPKQINFLTSLARGKELDEGDLLNLIHSTLGVNDVIVETMTSSQCSRVIDALKS